MEACCPYHNRLDQKLDAEHFHEMACGSLTRKPGPSFGLDDEPYYCCFKCPTLRAHLQAPPQPQSAPTDDTQEIAP